MAFIIYTVFIEWLVPDRSIINTYFQVWIMLFFMLVGESFRRDQPGDARFCFWVTLVVLPVWVSRTLWGLETYGPTVARTIVRSSEEAQALADQGFGGYPLVYAGVLCLPFLAQLAFRSRIETDSRKVWWQRWPPRILIWINLVLVVLLALRAGYSIAVLLAVLALLCVLLVGARSLLPLAMSVLAVAVLTLLASVAYEPALEFLEQASAGTEYSSKFRDILTSVEEGESTGTLEERTERYLKSINAFLENPVIGTLSLDPTGKHSAILDRFAKYGFGFGLLFVALLLHVPFRTLPSRHIPIGLAVGFLVVAALFPLVNNVGMSWGIMLYMFSRGAFVVMGVPLGQSQQPHAAAGVHVHA